MRGRDPETGEFYSPSRTRQRIEALEIRSLAEKLVALPAAQLARLPIPEELMPHIVELMTSFVPDGGASFFDASYYYDFVFKFLLVIGVAFVLPVFLVALNLAGIMSGIAILKGWRVAVLISTTFAALATPAADIASMLLLAGMMIILYLAAAGLSVLFDRRRSKRQPLLPTPGLDG